MAVTRDLRFCTERGRLLDLLNTAANDYATAANALSEEMATLGKAEYIRKRKDTEDARMDAQHAREALLAHKAQHGC